MMDNMLLKNYLIVLFPEVKDGVKAHDPETVAEVTRTGGHLLYVTAHKEPGSYFMQGNSRSQGGSS